jgi:hypothetical protein
MTAGYGQDQRIVLVMGRYGMANEEKLNMCIALCVSQQIQMQMQIFLRAIHATLPHAATQNIYI